MGDKIKLDIEGGGIFSKMMIAVQNTEKYGYGIENCYFNVIDSRALGESSFNPFDYILDQSYDESYKSVKHTGHKIYNKEERIEDGVEFQNLKEIVSKLKYKQELKVLVDDCLYMLGMDQDTIGVHVRLCDMNIAHVRDYGYVSFGDYIEALKKELDLSNKVFVASDNKESILKLQKLFGKRIVFLKDLIRAETEIENSADLQAKHFKEEKFWREAFLEMLLLSKCSKLICRTSNLAHMAIISSNTLQKIITL